MLNADLNEPPIKDNDFYLKEVDKLENKLAKIQSKAFDSYRNMQITTMRSELLLKLKEDAITASEVKEMLIGNKTLFE